MYYFIPYSHGLTLMAKKFIIGLVVVLSGSGSRVYSSAPAYR